MSSKKEQALEMFRQHKANCAQAVACAYCGLTGLDEATTRRMFQAFGQGMATMEGTCGALVGAGAVLSMADGDPRKTAQDTRTLVNTFRERSGAVICRELKGRDTGVVLRSCEECVAEACDILDGLLPAQD